MGCSGAVFIPMGCGFCCVEYFAWLVLFGAEEMQSPLAGAREACVCLEPRVPRCQPAPAVRAPWCRALNVDAVQKSYVEDHPVLGSETMKGFYVSCF